MNRGEQNTHGADEQSSFTYITLKGTVTKPACLIVRDKESLEKANVEMNSHMDLRNKVKYNNKDKVICKSLNLMFS